jgi:hypothetical protein
MHRDVLTDGTRRARGGREQAKAPESFELRAIDRMWPVAQCSQIPQATGAQAPGRIDDCERAEARCQRRCAGDRH